MKRSTSPIMIFVIVLIFGCNWDRDEEMAESKEDMKTTYCVGRSTIDMPASFAISNIVTGSLKELKSGQEFRKIDVSVFTSEISPLEYTAHTRKRENEIRYLTQENSDILKMVRSVTKDLTIFRVQRMNDAYLSEMIGLHENVMFTARLKSYENTFEKTEERLISLASRLKKIPIVGEKKEQGFCLGNLILTGDFEIEVAEYVFTDKNGILLSLDVNTYARNERIDLLSRVSGPKSLLTIFNVDHTVLRAREFSVAGMRAQEWLSWAVLQDDSDVRTHTFELETIRPTPGKLAPLITLTLSTAQPNEKGLPAETSMPDKEAIKLWDDIVASIRPAEI